jgi:hypothetical protein
LWAVAPKTNRVYTKVLFNLEQATKAQRVSRGIAVLFFNFGSRWGGWLAPRPGRFTSGNAPVHTI